MNLKSKLCSIALAICMLFGSAMTFSSCMLVETPGVVDAKLNGKGELVLYYDDGSEQNLGVVVGKDGEAGEKGENGRDGASGADGSLTITSDGSSVPAASAKGLRSAVSIRCNFEATVQQGGWRPGSSSTTTQEYTSMGSGVIYRMDKESGDAFIITNYHVVYDASSNTSNHISDDISVFLYGSEVDSKAIKATYVGGSLYYDIAVLRVEDSSVLSASNACEVTAANSDEIVVGETAIAIGNAKGYGISTSFGIVSVDSEYITMTAADGATSVSFRVMRVDTAVNSGNSGGGLYNDEGELIGIVNAKIVDDGVENIGYAIPSNVAVSIAENIIDYCYGTTSQSVQRAMLGITVSASDSKAVYNGETGLLEIQETVSVYEVTDGSIAQGILQAGDVLVSVVLDGETIEITRQYHIIDLMLDVRVDDEVTLNILRNGEAQTVSITITESCLTEY